MLAQIGTAFSLAFLAACLPATLCIRTVHGPAKVLTDASAHIWKRTFTGTHEGTEQHLHLWMRCQHEDSHVRLRALLAVEPVHQSIHEDYGLLVGPKTWDPQIKISINASSQHNLTHTFAGATRVDNLYLPSILTTNISDVPSLSGGWQVTIEGMDGIHVFDTQLCRPGPHAVAPSNVIALRSFLSADLDTAAALLVHHIRYHRCMGVDVHHLYVEPGQAQTLLQDRELAHMHSQQHVVFFEWPLRLFEGVAGGDRYGGHGIHIRIQYWQVVINNHALLAYWGTGAKVASVDIDEFLLGPVFEDQQNPPEQVACAQHMYMTCSDCEPGSSEFVQAWYGRTTHQALQSYKVDSYSEDTLSHSKCWVSAEANILFGVHNPQPATLLGDAAVYRHPIDSAAVMHFTSMLSERQRSWDSRSMEVDQNAYYDEDFARCLADS